MSKVKANVLPGSAGRLSGIDFSSNNFGGESINAAAATFKKDIQGQQFTFVKASQGTGYTNPFFASQWKILGEKVKSGQMALRVAYHFLDAGSAGGGVAQAKHFLAQMGIKGKLPAGTKLALDWEAGALGTPQVLQGAADYIHKVTGQWPLVYTSSANEATARKMVPHSPRWEANYGPSYKGIANEGGKILPSKSDTFDQYSDGRGYGKPYDLNVFNGSLSDLRKFAGFSSKPPPAKKPAHHAPPAAVAKLNRDLSNMNKDLSAEKKAEQSLTTATADEKAQLASIASQKQAIIAQLESATPPTGAALTAALDQLYSLGADQVKTEDRFGAKVATDKKDIASDRSGAAKWRKQGLKDLLPAEYKLNLAETNKDRKELGLRAVKKVIRPPVHGVGGTTANKVAQRFLGDHESYLEFSGKLHMDTWVSTSEDCANFVSGCLQAAGKLPAGQHSDNVTGLRDHLLHDGWKETWSGTPGGIPLSKAKPGDVVCFDGPGGAFQHVEIFNGFVNGRPQFIGSNNILSDGSQAISTDDGSWAYRVHVYAPPA